MKNKFSIFNKDLTKRTIETIGLLNKLLENISNNSVSFQLTLQNTAEFIKDYKDTSNSPTEIIDLFHQWGDCKIAINHEFFKNFLNFFKDFTGGNNDNYTNFTTHIKQITTLLFFITKNRNVFINNDRFYPNSIRHSNFSKLNEDVNKFFVLLFEQLKYYENISSKREIPNKIYIPSLRIASSLMINDKQKNNGDILKSTIAVNYKLPGDDKRIEIFTGYDLYRTIKTVRNNRRIIRKNFEEFERFLSNNFFDQRTIDVIAVEDNDESKQQIQIFIDGEDDRYLYDLGDGIQSLIILFYPIFMAEDGTWIFI